MAECVTWQYLGVCVEFLIVTALAMVAILAAYRPLLNQKRGKFARLHYTSKAIQFIVPQSDETNRIVKVWSGGRELVDPVLVVLRF